MIKLLRVDHRLLHGQVVFSWTKVLGTNCILIANDAVAKDELRMSALRLSKPADTKLVIKSLEDSVQALNSGVTEKYNLFILTETIQDAYFLCENVKDIQYINLGGAKIDENKRQISKALFVSNEDCVLLKKLNERGVKAEVQMVPDDSPQDVMKLI